MLELVEYFPTISLWLMTAVGFFLGNCPCCGNDPECGYCATVNETWRVTVSGISDDMPSPGVNCTNFNGTFDFDSLGFSSISSCATFITIASGHRISFTILTDTTPQVIGFILDFNNGIAGFYSRYDSAVLTRNCTNTDNETMNLTSNSTQCTGWPATLTLEAV